MTETTVVPPTPAAATLNRRHVARSAALVMGLFVVSRVLGLVREAVIAERFGDLPEYAAYLAAFRLPDLLFNLVAGGALASAFIPTLTQYLTRDDHEGGWHFTSAVANWLILGLGGLAILAGITAPLLVPTIIAPGFSPELVSLTVMLMRFMLVSTLVFSISGLLMGTLNAYDQFLMPAIAPVMYNLGILAGALFLAPRIGVYGLAVGVVLGAVGHALVQLPALGRLGFRYSLSLGRNNTQIRDSVRQALQLMGPRVLGAALVQLMFLTNTFIASFYNPSILTALNYAWIIMLLPHGIFASSLATAIFPTFSRMAAVRDQAGMRVTLSQLLRVLLFIVIPSAVGLFVLRVPIIQLLFQRGEFGADTTQAVAWALAFYSLGLVSHSLVEVISRAYFALQDTRTPVAIGVGAMILNIILSVALIPFIGDSASVVRGPQGALALANTLASGLELCFLLWFLRPKMGGLEGRKLLGSGLRMGAAAVVMGAVLWWVQQSQLTTLSIWLYTPLAIALGGAAYAAAAWLLRVEEMRMVLGLVLRRRG